MTLTCFSEQPRPVLSLCIPTFNRANCLDNLLESLVDLKNRHGNQVEICISNNHSTDSTSHVIEKWKERLEFKYVIQSKNIGFTLNAIAVSREATGKWLMLVGDDDGLIAANFAKLLHFLQTLDEKDWILAGVADKSGREHLLGKINPNRYDANQFWKILLRTGLYRYGFIGMHVFPSTLKNSFSNLSLKQAQPWPHIALFLRHLDNGHIDIFPEPIVKQAASGEVVSWNPESWVYISLRKLNIIAEVQAKRKLTQYFYFWMLVLRELYAKRNLISIIVWKLFDAASFSASAIREVSSRYKFAGPLIAFTAIHFMFIVALTIIPSNLLRRILPVGVVNEVSRRKREQPSVDSVVDGVRRGM